MSDASKSALDDVFVGVVAFGIAGPCQAVEGLLNGRLVALALESLKPGEIVFQFPAIEARP